MLGFGAGPSKDNFGSSSKRLVVFGIYSQGTPEIDSDSVNSTDGIGFRGATPYIH